MTGFLANQEPRQSARGAGAEVDSGRSGAGMDSGMPPEAQIRKAGGSGMASVAVTVVVWTARLRSSGEDPVLVKVYSFFLLHLCEQVI